MRPADDATERRWVGSRVRHAEDVRFITGQATYTDDVRLPGTLHAAFVRSSHAHANLRAIDVGEALRVPGVVAALTAADLAGQALPIRVGNANPTYRPTGQPLLAADKVRMVGEAVAVIVGEDRYAAEDGADAVAVEYEPLAPVTGVDAAIGVDAPVVHQEAPDNLHMTIDQVTGDVERAFAEADLTVELELRTQRQAAVCLEPRSILATCDPSTSELTVWVSSQTPHLFRSALAGLLAMPESRIRVISAAVGGGFGQKHVLHPEEVVIPFLARRLRRPVKWTCDRREDLQASAHAREQLHRIRAAVRADGRVIGLRAEIYSDSGAYSVWPVSAGLEVAQAADNVPGPYDIPNYARKGYAVITNKAPVGPYRGVGRPHGCMVHERLMDEIARRLGLDPREVRSRNFVRSFPHVTSGGFHLDSGDFAGTLDLALDRIGYDELRRRHRALAKEGVFRGVGIGFHVEQSAQGMSEWARRGVTIAAGYDTAQLRFEPDGKVRLAVGLHSHGQGQETTMAQIAADELSLEIADIDVVFGDTGQVPYGFGSYASRGTVYCGGATILAARDVREKAQAIAAHILDARPAEVVLSRGRFSVRERPERWLAWADVARIAHHEGHRLPPDMEPGLESVRRYRAAEWGSFSNSAHVVEVEVDIDTGAVELLNYVIAEDCGRVVNPTGVEGQIHGGVAQGIGGAFLEQLRYDGDGRLLCASLFDYLLPGFMEVPDIEVVHLETPSPTNLGGFKGMGESGCISVAPAVANAISAALRPLGTISIDETPITPESILNELAAAPAAAAAARAAEPT